jgi:dihydrofolate synthase/folylpolyglutamate synthase
LTGIGDALAWLDAHQNLERMLAGKRPPRPDLDRMRRLVDLLGHPESACPAIHVTGTNGKTSTARATSELLRAQGLRVGTYTSPHLQSINERIVADAEPISDSDLESVLVELAGVEPLLGSSSRPTWFELITAAGLLWFADRPVDVSVMEVGLGGRWDATNVVDADVAVVTNIGLDHVEFLGSTRAEIAGEKAGIIKPGATAVIGERDQALVGIFERERPAEMWLAGRDFGCARNTLAVGGRLLDLFTPAARYEEVWLDLHGSHQGENFACALAAVEAFFGRPLDEAVVREVAGSISSPGRLEVVRRHPLVLLDGAKNLEGARAAGAAVDEEFPSAASRILVVGMLRGKDPAQMLEALGARQSHLVVACPPPSPRAQPAASLVAAAASLGVEAVEAADVPEALQVALNEAGPDDLVLVSGSLYVVGAARAALAAEPVH